MTSIKNVEGFNVPTISKQNIEYQTKKFNDTAIPEYPGKKEDGPNLKMDEESTSLKGTVSSIAVEENFVIENEIIENDSVIKEDDNHKEPKTIRIAVTSKPMLRGLLNDTDLKEIFSIEDNVIDETRQNIQNEEDLFLGLLGGISSAKGQGIQIGKDRNDNTDDTLNILFSIDRNDDETYTLNESIDKDDENNLLIGLLGGSNSLEEVNDGIVPGQTNKDTKSSNRTDESNLGILVLLQDPEIYDTANVNISDSSSSKEEELKLGVLDVSSSDVNTRILNMTKDKNEIKVTNYKEAKNIKTEISNNEIIELENKNANSKSDKSTLELLLLPEKTDEPKNTDDKTNSDSNVNGFFPSLPIADNNETNENKLARNATAIENAKNINYNITKQNDLGILVLLQDFNGIEIDNIESDNSIEDYKKTRNDIFNKIMTGFKSSDGIRKNDTDSIKETSYKESKDIKDTTTSTKNSIVEDVYLGLLIGESSIELNVESKTDSLRNKILLNKNESNSIDASQSNKLNVNQVANNEKSEKEIKGSFNILDILFETSIGKKQGSADENTLNIDRNYKTPKGISIEKDVVDTGIRLLLLGEAPDVTFEINPTRMNEFGSNSDENLRTHFSSNKNLSREEEPNDRKQNEVKDVDELSILGIILERLPQNNETKDINQIDDFDEGSGSYIFDNNEISSSSENSFEPKSSKVPDDTIKSNENDNLMYDDFSILSIVLGDNNVGTKVTTQDQMKKGKVINGNNVKVMILETTEYKDDKDNLMTNNLRSKNDISKTSKNFRNESNITAIPSRLNIKNSLDSSLLLLLVENPKLGKSVASFDGSNKSSKKCIEPCIDTSNKSMNNQTDDIKWIITEEEQFSMKDFKSVENSQNDNSKNKYPYYPIDYFPP